MTRNVTLALGCALLIAGVTAGCKPKPKPPPVSPASPAYFQTPWQSESQFIVQAIVTDLAEQIFYASSNRLPDQNQFLVSATEIGKSQDTPVFELSIDFGQKRKLKFPVTIEGPIWSPAVYQNIAEKLAQAVGLNIAKQDKSENAELLSKLVDGAPETIERENQRVSTALESDFKNPDLHEEAAMLVAAFLLREHSGRFLEIRSPLSRVTAHLAMARLLRGVDGFGLNGKMAEATMLVLVNDSAPAVERLNAIATNDNTVAAMSHALRAVCTGDYRALDAAKERSRVEDIAWFMARADYLGMPSTWLRLTDEQKQRIDFFRAANQLGYSVEIGHELLRSSVPLELQEISSVYHVSHGDELAESELVTALNVLPERCFSNADGGKIRVNVIGWGQWAMFFQRQLCHAVQQNHVFMNNKWGVRDEAKEFAKNCEQKFGALRLYPFVRYFNSSDVDSYHKAVDDGFKLTVASPHLVSAECWNYLCYKPSFAPLYQPVPNPHVNEWHKHNPPPGTVYNLHPRLSHPSLTERGDVIAKFEKLHELSPCDNRVSSFLAKTKFNEHPTYEQAEALYRAVLPYSVNALRNVAATLQQQPVQYEKIMLQAAELDPSCYYILGNYAFNQKQDEKAAQYIEKGCSLDLDSIRVASHAIRRVRYFLSKGDMAKAREIADDAGEVYSSAGLEAKAVFFEETTNYPAAFEWYSKIEERYQESFPILSFCIRYKAQTGDKRFDPEVEKRLSKLFPKGIEKVALKNLYVPPKYGVIIKQENDLLKSAGLKAGDVIVALGGTRVYDLAQYTYLRDLKDDPELELIVWQGKDYREIRASPPHHRFGVEFGDYAAK